MAKTSRNEQRVIRHWRIRANVTGTAERPRLAVFRSNKYVYAQVIDDANGKTIAAAASNQKDLRTQLGGKCSNLEAAKLVGSTVAARAKEKGVTKVAFDRGGYQYHGRVKALADAAREGGLEF